MKPLKRLTVKKSQPLLSIPASTGIQKKVLAPGEKISVLAAFNDFYVISDNENTEGWVLKKQL
jgi:hypothetical protein